MAEWLANWARRDDQCAALEAAIAAAVGVRSCTVLSTGRAAMTVLLRALRSLSAPDRDEVIVPSYTCYSVAASVVKAGLVPRIADVDPTTLDFDYDRLEATDFRRVAAVVATNLYGIPSDLPRLRVIARLHRAFVVDDAAQALGAHRDGRPCGTLGDAGLYSFDKGKNISAIDGGAIVTEDARIADAVSRETAGIRDASVGEASHAMVKLAAYALLLHPRLYWIPKGIPMLGLGRTVYTTAYPIARQPAGLSALGRTMLPRLADYTAHRRRTAEAMLAGLCGEARVSTPAIAAGADPAYLRFPVLLDSRESRDVAITRLNDAGIGATGSYPASIADIPELRGRMKGDQEARGGRAVADRILTLPTHPYVTEADATRAVRVLLSAVRSVSRAPAAVTPGVASVVAQ